MSPTPSCLNRLIDALLWASNVGSIHALFHSQHIPSSAAAWRNMSHTLDTSSRVFLVLSSVSWIQSFPFLALGESCTQCYCGAFDLFHIPVVFIPIVLTKHLFSLPHSKAETGGKRSSRTFFLAFESSAPKTGRGFSSKLMKSSIL